MTTTITEYIPYGRENAISRKELIQKTKLTDRQVRHSIQLARDNGELILNLSNGYYRARETDIDELTAQYFVDRARALTVLKRLKTLRRILKEAGVKV